MFCPRTKRSDWDARENNVNYLSEARSVARATSRPTRPDRAGKQRTDDIFDFALTRRWYYFSFCTFLPVVNFPKGSFARLVGSFERSSGSQIVPDALFSIRARRSFFRRRKNAAIPFTSHISDNSLSYVPASWKFHGICLSPMSTGVAECLDWGGGGGPWGEKSWEEVYSEFMGW